MRDPDPVLTRIIGFSVLVVLAAIVLSPLVSRAAVVHLGEAKGDVVKLTDEPCVAQALQKVKPEYRGGFRAASYYISRDKQTIVGCWWEYNNEYITIWDDGDVFALPKSFFRASKI